MTQLRAWARAAARAPWVYLIACIAVGYYMLRKTEQAAAVSTWTSEPFNDPRVKARIALVLIGIGITQAGVIALRKLFSWRFDYKPILGAPNERPQRYVGIVENTLYPWIFFQFGTDAAAAVAAWIGLKMLGNWKGWEARDPDPASGSETAEQQAIRKHEGRRRMYAFLLLNVVQVFCALVVTWAMWGTVSPSER